MFFCPNYIKIIFPKKLKTLISFPNFKNLYSCILKIHTLISLVCVGVLNKYSLKPYC